MERLINLTFYDAKKQCLPYTHRMKRKSGGSWVVWWACGNGFGIRHSHVEGAEFLKPDWQYDDHNATDWIVEQLPAPYWSNPFNPNRQKIWDDFIQYRRDTGILTNDLICDFIRFEVKTGLRKPAAD